MCYDAIGNSVSAESSFCALDEDEVVPPGLEAGFCGRLSMEVWRMGGEHGEGRKVWLKRNGIYMVLSGGKRQRA